MDGTEEALGSARQIFGRTAELSAITAAAKRAAGGEVAAVFVVGEAGIGKTALVEAWWRSAGDLAAVRWGRCWHEAGAPAYWPWIQVLRPLVEEHGLASEREGPLADLLAAGHAAVQARERNARETAEGQFVLFDAILAFLVRVAGDAPLVIVLDDLHSADRATMLVLSFLLRSTKDGRLLIVGTLRDVEASASPDIHDVVVDVLREGTRIVVGGLDEEAVARLVAVAGAEATREEIRGLLDATGGNPLLVQQIAGLCAAEGRRIALENVELPRTVTEVIERRLRLLPVETRKLLDCAAVLGADLRHDLLREIAGLTPVALEEALLPARRLRVLETVGPQEEQFVHAALCEVLYRALEPTERAALHRAAVTAHERATELGSDPPATKILHHLLRAGAVDEPARVVAHALKAAEEASRVFAFQDAATLLESAEQCLRGVTLDPRLKIELLLALGAARSQGGDEERGKASCERALEHARALGDEELFARAALAFGASAALFDSDVRVVSWLGQAKELLGDAESTLAARVRARLAVAMQPAPEPDVPVRLAHEAIEMARKAGDAEVLLDVLHTACGALMDFEDPRSRRALNTDAAELAARHHDHPKRIRAYARLVVDSLELGDMRGATSYALMHARLAHEHGRDRDRWRVLMFCAERAIQDGRFQDALRFQERARAISDAREELDVDLCYVAQRLAIARAAERHADLITQEAEMVAALASAPYAALWQAVFAAALRARVGDVAGTRAAREGLPPQRRPALHDPHVLYLEAEAAAVANDRPRLEVLADVLPSWMHRFGSGGLRLMTCEGPLSRSLGLTLAALGRTTEALSAFEDAARRAALGCRPHLARIHIEHAELLLGTGEVEACRPIANAARALVDLLELEDLRPRLIELETRLGAPPPPRPNVEDEAPIRVERDGDVWRVSQGTRSVTIRRSRGIEILARLAEHPGEAFHVLELVSDRSRVDGGDAGPAIDARARDAYRRRLMELRTASEDAEARGDVEGYETLHQEIEALAHSLARDVGLSGRGRQSANAAERARVNVKKRIEHALSKIEALDEVLARRIRRALRTGTFCELHPSE